jgi:hypothetical protein
MILYVEFAPGERQWYKISDVEDLAQVYMHFPMAEDIAMGCSTLKEAVQCIAEYLDGHNMRSWVEDAEISKSLRSKAAALGIALASSVPSVTQAPHPMVSPSMHATPVQAEAPKDDFGSHPSDSFLWNIQQIESSGGNNVNHKPIRSGKFKGMRAVGKWGLLKPTVKELVGRMRMDGSLTPEYAKLENMSRDQLDEHFKKNPQIELGLARRLAQHVIRRQGGNLQRAAYAWLHGHNLMPRDITKDKLSSSDYVNKFTAISQLNPFRKPTGLSKSMPEVESEDFKMRVKNWYKRREDEITEDPMRSSNFQPDPGRIRDEKLDEVKPDSMKSSMQKLADNVKTANERK